MATPPSIIHLLSLLSLTAAVLKSTADNNYSIPTPHFIRFLFLNTLELCNVAAAALIFLDLRQCGHLPALTLLLVLLLSLIYWLISSKTYIKMLLEIRAGTYRYGVYIWGLGLLLLATPLFIPFIVAVIRSLFLSPPTCAHARSDSQVLLAAAVLVLFLFVLDVLWLLCGLSEGDEQRPLLGRAAEYRPLMHVTTMCALCLGAGFWLAFRPTHQVLLFAVQVVLVAATNAFVTMA